ncbi:FHA domain-containing protein [Paenibacillus solisilvae]|uniref:FHA domain-containing protein n=1 Tax=Paenibacillus solisilvae TaxID=2486751 RepID=A0ABW0VSS0_9BACL
MPNSPLLSHVSSASNQPIRASIDVINKDLADSTGSNRRFGLMESIERRTAVSERQEGVQLSRMINNDATVLLGQDKQAEENESRLPACWLEREAEGVTEQIVLQAVSFVIGRAGDGVHYVDSSSGISRAHLELSGKQGEWAAKDVGSRNGSAWNGQMMIPYKAYPLKSGDCIQLAGNKGPKYFYRTL